MCIPFAGYLHCSLGVLRDPDPHLHNHSLMRIPALADEIASQDLVSAVAFRMFPLNPNATYLCDPGKWRILVSNPPWGQRLPAWALDLVTIYDEWGFSFMDHIDYPPVNSIVHAAAAWAPTALSCDNLTVWRREIMRDSGAAVTMSQGYHRYTYCLDVFPSPPAHNTDGPAVVVQDPATHKITRVEYYNHGLLYRNDGPAVIDLTTDTVEYHQHQQYEPAVAMRMIADRYPQKADRLSRHRSAADHLSDCDFSGVPILSPTYS